MSTKPGARRPDANSIDHEAIPELGRWIAKADGDLNAARLLRHQSGRVLPSIVGFHAQQAVEKYLKAVIVAGGGTPRKEHSITELWKTIDHLPRLEGLPLTRFAVTGRYPRLDDGADDEPTWSEIDDAIGYAEVVRSAVTGFLGRIDERRVSDA